MPTSGCENRLFLSLNARVKVWLAALRESKEALVEDHIICEDHFLTDHITPRGISEDAIPIMPPYLDGPLSMISPWGDDSSGDEQYDEEEDADGDHGEDDRATATHNDSVEGACNGTPVEAQQPAHNFHKRVGGTIKKTKGAANSTEISPSVTKSGGPRIRRDLSLVTLTKKFLRLMLVAPYGVIDLNDVAKNLNTRKRRVYDITNCLEGVRLIKKQSANMVKWIAPCPVSSFVGPKQRLQQELKNLKTVEESLDELIKTCAQQLFEMTDSLDNKEYPFRTPQTPAFPADYYPCFRIVLFNVPFTLAYVTHSDLSGIRVFQEQTVIAIKAPEETKLEVPTPKEDSIQIHLRGGRGPIKVMMCEMGGAPLDAGGGVKTTGFLSLEESRIQTKLLQHTGEPTGEPAEPKGVSSSHNAVQSG
ncbi:hypothetical protein DPEC_G00319050 [Dallia pectoralis]|uniref:Uncharacterized protein n=1 Tax=Dallia pectoralis TaxID=75939 RepID=A0ACC2F9E0_DALPE|nr:hypothetical protein DPEC_G00319050 [Dallia pectoralis]